MSQVEANAGIPFADAASNFAIRYLEQNGDSPGEDITDACKIAGIVPHDDRAFGPVYMSLSRRGVIECKGMVPRRKGHGTSGGKVWGLSVACFLPLSKG